MILCRALSYEENTLDKSRLIVAFCPVIRQMATHQHNWLINARIAGIIHLHIEVIPLAVQLYQVPLMAQVDGASFAA